MGTEEVTVPTQAEEAQAEEAQAAKVLRLEMRVTPDTNQHLEKLANYAALEGIIPSDTVATKLRG